MQEGRAMKESQIQAKIIKYLESIGAYVVNGIYSKKGVPDLIGIYKGKGFGIEVKKPETKNNTTKLQDYHLEQIRQAAGVSCVATSVEEVVEFIKEIK